MRSSSSDAQDGHTPGLSQRQAVQDSPLYARPEQSWLQVLPPESQPVQQAQHGSDSQPQAQHDGKHQAPQQHTQQLQQAGHMQHAAPLLAQQQPGESWQQRQQQQVRSNVVEIDDVEVTPIDDPFYDPNDPSSSFERSSRQPSTAAVLAEDGNTANAKHPSNNAVAIDDVDFEGFAAPLLDEADAGSWFLGMPPGWRHFLSAVMCSYQRLAVFVCCCIQRAAAVWSFCSACTQTLPYNHSIAHSP